MPAPPADPLAALERRVAALERRLRLAAAPASEGRVSQAEAAAALSCSTRQARVYVARGLLVRLPKPPGAAKGCRTYFDPANVRALAESEDAAREWVARRKYVPKSHRPGAGVRTA